MPYDAEVLQQDLKAAKNALEKDDLENFNIIGNRIMSNCHLFDEKQYFLLGFMIKDIANTLLPLKYSKNAKAVSTAKILTAGIFKKIFDYSSKVSASSAELWNEFHDFNNKVRRFTMLEFEEDAYTGERPDVTHEAIQILFKRLEENKEKLLEPNCLLLKGIINEISRLHKVHGSTLHDEFASAFVVMLDRCYDYIVQVSNDQSAFQREVRSVIFPNIEQSLRILRESESKEGAWQQQIDDTLFALVNRWREYFLIYMEKGAVTSQQKTTVMLPDESRKKLTEAIARTLEDEMPKKNK